MVLSFAAGAFFITRGVVSCADNQTTGKKGEKATAEEIQISRNGVLF
jgi:hypothetical protein